MNIKFNLLPWRNQHREQQKKNFIATTVAVVLLVGGVLGFNYYIETDYIDNQEQAKSLLQSKINQYATAENEVKRLSKMIKDINQQIDVIESLREKRQKLFIGLEDIAQAVPASVFLTAINLDDKGQLTINGYAENEKGVAAFIRQLSEVKGIQDLQLQNIQAAVSNQSFTIPENSEVKSFVLSSKFD